MVTTCDKSYVTIVDMTFNDWLLKELSSRGWSQADLSRNSGLTRGAISNYINGRDPDKKALRKLAKGLNLPIELILEKAGELQEKSELSPLRRQLLHLSEGLPDSDIELALKILESRAEYYVKNPQAKPRD